MKDIKKYCELCKAKAVFVLIISDFIYGYSEIFENAFLDFNQAVEFAREMVHHPKEGKTAWINGKKVYTVCHEECDPTDYKYYATVTGKDINVRYEIKTIFIPEEFLRKLTKKE